MSSSAGSLHDCRPPTRRAFELRFSPAGAASHVVRPGSSPVIRFTKDVLSMCSSGPAVRVRVDRLTLGAVSESGEVAHRREFLPRSSRMALMEGPGERNYECRRVGRRSIGVADDRMRELPLVAFRRMDKTRHFIVRWLPR